MLFSSLSQIISYNIGYKKCSYCLLLACLAFSSAKLYAQNASTAIVDTESANTATSASSTEPEQLVQTSSSKANASIEIKSRNTPAETADKNSQALRLSDSTAEATASSTEKQSDKKAEKTQQKLIDKAVDEFQVKDESGQVIICSKEDTIAVNIDGKVSYRCRTKDKALGEDKHSQRGEGETNSLIEDLLDKTEQTSDKKLELNQEELQQIKALKKSKEEAAAKASEQKTADEQAAAKKPIDDVGKAPSPIDIEAIDASADKETLDSAEIILSPDLPSSDDSPALEDAAEDHDIIIKDSEDDAKLFSHGRLIKRLPFKAYLSLRANYYPVNDNQKFSDGGTRGGIIYAKKLDDGDSFVAHAEFGSNILDKLDDIFTQDEQGSSDSKISRRLMYLRYGRDDYYTVLGKNWSVYHYIAGMTDRFIVVGGKASGIYNAGTDGGDSGTGRANKAIQIRSSRGKVQWGMQLQANNPIAQIDDVNFDLNAGLMAKWKTLFGIGLGVAYNRAIPERYTAEMQAKGFTSNDSAWVVGAEWDIKQWYFSTTYSQSKNHVTDNTYQYYDAYGWEFYGSRVITPRTQARIGWNIQNPTDKDAYQGDHQIEEYYLSWQYTYNSKNIEDKIYTEYVYNLGRLADGTRPDNSVVIGIRYNLNN